MNTFADSIRRAAIPLAVALSPIAASAHPGHLDQPVHGFAQAIAHLLTEPDHLALIAAAVAIAVLASRRMRRRSRERDDRAGRADIADDRPRSR